MNSITEELREKTRLAARLLTENLKDPPSVPSLCEAIELSEFQLKKGFHEVFQTTVGAYLRTVRMERAARLLKETGNTVASIAEALGYANPSRFAEAFRKHHGRNPRDFRAG